MFTRCRMFRRISSFTAAGGGVPGKAAGTVPIITTEDGVITEVYRLSTETFLPVGEMISEIANGKGIRGNISGYRIRTFSATGAPGNRINTGKNIIPGAFRDCLPEISRAMSGQVTPRADRDTAIVREKGDPEDKIENSAV